MTFTPEQMNKAKSAKSADELLTLAKESGIEMTADEAAKYFAELHKEGELNDNELASVAGGKGEPEPLFKENDRVIEVFANLMAGRPADAWTGTIQKVSFYDETYGWQYLVNWDKDASTECSESNLKLYEG